MHTQEVLTAIESTLAEVLDAESAVRGYLASADARALDPLDRAERGIDTDLSRLTTLTRDNPNQQARMPALRQDATRTLAALRALADAKRSARASSPADVETAQASLEAVRRTIWATRTEEHRLLADRAPSPSLGVCRCLRARDDGTPGPGSCFLVFVVSLPMFTPRRVDYRSPRRRRDDLFPIRQAVTESLAHTSQRG